MARVPFTSTAQVVLNGSGAGTAKIGPLSAMETLYPQVASVTVATNTLEAQCSIYVGDVNTKRFIDGTFTGSSGDSTDKINASVIKSSQYVWATWTGGDANATATLTVSGMKDI